MTVRDTLPATFALLDWDRMLEVYTQATTYAVCCMLYRLQEVVYLLAQRHCNSPLLVLELFRAWLFPAPSSCNLPICFRTYLDAGLVYVKVWGSGYGTVCRQSFEHYRA